MAVLAGMPTLISILPNHEKQNAPRGGAFSAVSKRHRIRLFFDDRAFMVMVREAGAPLAVRVLPKEGNLTGEKVGWHPWFDRRGPPIAP